MMTHEIWKPVEGFDHPYEVSNLGRLRGPQGETWGHFTGTANIVSVKKDGKQFCMRLKYLVAKAFVPNPDNLPFVKEKDGDCQNCRADNLFWSGRRIPERYVKEKHKKAASATPYAPAQAMMKKVPKCPHDCIHRGYWDTGVWCCEYILNTGHRRPCPPGHGCTEYRQRSRTRKPTGIKLR